MGKGSNVQKKNTARERHNKEERSKGKGGGGSQGKAVRTGATAPKSVCIVCRVRN